MVWRSSECISEFLLMGQQGGDMEGVGLGEGGLPAMWWDIQGIVWTECIWSCEAEIFCQRGWSIEVSPYSTKLTTWYSVMSFHYYFISGSYQ